MGERWQGGFPRVVWLAACAGLVACGAPAPWNVLLVTFDTTRADRLGCYGDADATTPHVDALAAEGVRFERAFTAAPITAPSHATILTGRTPVAHGVRDNGLFALAPGETTLAERLRARGYATAAAVGAFPLVARFGFDQGFELYDDRVERPRDVVARRGEAPRGLFFDERPASFVNEAILPWLAAQGERPFFLWLHYYDPHRPFAPPAPWDQLHAGDPYAGEIAYADEALGVVLEALRARGQLERTLVVFTSDHGEGLGEHGEETHSLLLYNGTLRVPLVIRAPGAPGGLVVEETVGTVDVVPTVLDLLGLEVPADLDGRSLAASVRGGAAPTPRPLYAETLSPRFAHDWGELRAWLDGDWKYVHGPAPELFDLGADFAELSDRAAAEPATAARLRDDLEAFLASHADAGPAAPRAVDAETRSRLLALGYVSADAPAPVPERLRADGVPPREHVAQVGAWSTARSLLFEGRAAEAGEVLDTLLEVDPGNPAYLRMRAQAAQAQGDHDGAVAALERARALRGDADGALGLALAAAELARGDADRAAEHLREAVAASPSAPTLLLLAELEFEGGRAPAGDAALTRALAADPGYAPARLRRAIAEAGAGQGEAAEQSFRALLRDQPYYARAHYNHGAFLAREGRNEEALRAFERAIALEPRYGEAHDGRVVVLRELGRDDEAARAAETLAAVAPPASDAGDRVLARYQGGVVTAAQLDAYLVSLPAELRRLPGDDAEGFAGARIRELALRDLWLREARATGVETDPAFASALRGAARRAQAARRMAELLPPIPEPTEAELRARYDAEPGRSARRSERRFVRPARRLVRHWYVRVRPGEAVEEATGRLEALRARHLAGASFGELARAHSESQSRHEEGSLGWLSPWDLPPRVADVVFALEVGATSDPVVFGGGAHVFLVEQAVAPRRYAFEELRPSLARAWREEVRAAALEAALAGHPLPAGSDVPAPAEALERILRGAPDEVVARVGREVLRQDAARRALAALRTGDRVSGDAELAGRAVAAWAAGEHLLQASEGGAADPVEDADPELRDALLVQLARERALRASATEEVLRHFHDRHALRFATPLRLELRRVAVPLGPDPDATMAAFEALTASPAPTLEALRSFARARGGAEVELGWRALPDLLAESPTSGRLVAPLAVGAWSPPHRLGEELVALGVEAREEPEARPFEAVREDVERAWLAHHGAEALRAADEARLEAAGFELLAGVLPAR